MILKVSTKARCPHCGKLLLVNVDLAQPEQAWTDECAHCDKPVRFSSRFKDGRLEVETRQER